MRQAREEDAPAIEILIRVSVRVLQSSRYSKAQIEEAIGSVFGLDQQLLWDGTYFIAERTSAAAVGASARHFLAAMP